ncbi:MAG: phosphotransferase [Ardenticatenaceae bacterium]|nr:phosphotransferase [Anaerolineales bacterium]MCB8919951.1 phosphotransferase [Ardenticatenaceae bacterium]MCB8989798.1 phosphotransferase [Ardenticatenaceae bacterium]MCB9003974.1 phosphotransferase [Ardenticatenaceae bacterium]
METKLLQRLFDTIAPGSAFVALHPLEGDFSNSTQLVTGKAPDATLFQIVTRRYAVFGDYDRGEKARREFKTLQLLKRHGLPVPDPLYIDETGTILGSPDIVTGYVPGKLVMAQPYPAQWAEKLAKTLAQIHRVPINDSDTSFLLDGNSEVLWFLKSPEQMPPYISNHPKGRVLWQAALDYVPALIKVKPSLVHIDYWSGNVLWNNDSISAVVDWEEASQGDAGIDVAYCRMDMILCGLREAADTFLATYESEMGQPVANLGFWELTAAVRPMFSPDGWISEPPAIERFAEFVDNAIQRTRS